MQKWTRNSLVLASSLAFLVGHAHRAHAQDLPDLPDVRAVCVPEVSFRRARIEHEGHGGLWFQEDVALCMVGRLGALPLYANRVRLLEERLRRSDERHEILTGAIEMGERIEERYRTALTAATRRASAAEAELGAWYRSPILWAVVGAVVAGALVVVASFALGAVSP